MIDKKRNIRLFELCAFAAVSVIGTLLHFAYDLFGTKFSALFSGVNESTWEHMKLLFFPMLFAAFVCAFFLKKEYAGYWQIKLRSVLMGLVLIPVLFYTLGGIFGKTPDFVNIGIFFISAAAAYIYEAHAFKKNDVSCKYENFALVALALIALLFFIFTFAPPKIPLFQDPIDGSYGI